MTPVSKPILFKSISELTRTMGLPAPLHPLVALVSYDVSKISLEHAGRSFLIDFYKISFKRDFHGQVRYGQGYYDFEEGGLAFLAPNQLVTLSGDERSYEGYTLYFHADLIRNYPLCKNMHQYGFFSYAANEALFLSEKEKRIIGTVFDSIATELDNGTDAYSQDVLVSQIGLLLNYSNRFYNRQFITRKGVHNDTISRMNHYLAERFRSGTGGIPTVSEVAEQLGVSSRYLKDMLKSLTGQSTQQHIHDHLIERAKTILSTTRLHVAEVAYQLGFEHPQSFSKLFKAKTSFSPLQFRRKFD